MTKKRANDKKSYSPFWSFVLFGTVLGTNGNSLNPDQMETGLS